MVKFNERPNLSLKKTKIKLAGLDKWEIPAGEMVSIYGEDGRKFTSFLQTWNKQGLKLEDLDYGQELAIEYREKTMADGRTFLNFVNVYKAGENLPF